MLVDRLDCLGRKLQCDPFLLFRNIKALGLEVGIKPPFGLVVRVRDLVPCLRTLSCDFTNPCHNSLIFKIFLKKDCKYREKPANNPKRV